MAVSAAKRPWEPHGETLICEPNVPMDRAVIARFACRDDRDLALRAVNAHDQFDELVEALDDLATACEAYFCGAGTENCPDDETVAYGDCKMTFGDIRRALTALAKARGEPA